MFDICFCIKLNRKTIIRKILILSLLNQWKRVRIPFPNRHFLSTWTAKPPLKNTLICFLLLSMKMALEFSKYKSQPIPLSAICSQKSKTDSAPISKTISGLYLEMVIKLLITRSKWKVFSSQITLTICNLIFSAADKSKTIINPHLMTLSSSNCSALGYLHLSTLSGTSATACFTHWSKSRKVISRNLNEWNKF